MSSPAPPPSPVSTNVRRHDRTLTRDMADDLWKAYNEEEKRRDSRRKQRGADLHKRKEEKKNECEKDEPHDSAATVKGDGVLENEREERIRNGLKNDASSNISSLIKGNIVSPLSRSQNSLSWVLGFHVIFALVALMVLLLPFPVALSPGFRESACVLLYNSSVPSFAIRNGLDDWIEMWILSAAVSFFQLLPYWFLVQSRAIVPGYAAHRYLAGMWTFPCFMTLISGREAKNSGCGACASYSIAVALGGGILISSEFIIGQKLNAWKYSQNTLSNWYHLALQIVVPNILLPIGLSYVDQTSAHSYIARVLVAPPISLMYTGALALSCTTLASCAICN